MQWWVSSELFISLTSLGSMLLLYERANLPTVPTKNENGTRTAIGGGEFQSQRGSRIALST
jgi:hypothetical protein